MLKINFSYYAFFILSLLFNKYGNSQELVSNGDFETYTNCPNYVSQIHFAEGWSKPTDGTPDYFNACLTTPWSMGVPGNQFGDEAAHSGDGYAGFYAFYSVAPFITVDDDDREYVNTILVESMEIGETYSVEFFVSLSEASKYGVEVLGILFSTEVPTREDELAITLLPQLIFWDAEELTNKNGWTKISACFVADSAYQYLTIGNFNNGINTNATYVGSQTSNLHYSYYYVDDVSVIKLEKPEFVYEDPACGPLLVGVSNYDADEIFEWSTGEHASSIVVENSGLFWASINSNACTLVSDTIFIELAESFSFTLGEDQIVDFCEVNYFSLKALDYTNENALYTWSNGQTGPEIIITSPGTYSLTITNENGCSVEDIIEIKNACEGTLYLPSSFSPNGDGRNDIFYLKGHNITLHSFQIFDRWGVKVFESSDINVGWEAIDNPIGVYVWKLSYSNTGIQDVITKMGSVMLLR